MPATSREQNVARIEHQVNMCWQQILDTFLANKEIALVVMQDCENVADDKHFAAEHPFAVVLIDLGMGRVVEEGVRRGILPEQEIKP